MVFILMLMSVESLGADYKMMVDVERFKPEIGVFSPPEATVQWELVKLPLMENPHHYSTMTEYEVNWFRIKRQDLSLQNWTQPALYIWRHNVRTGAFLGGRDIGGTLNRAGDEQLNISWNHPLLIDIPVNIEGDLMIRVDAGPGGTVLSPIIVGERQALADMFEERNFFQIELSFWLFVLCGLLSGLSFWLWLQRRGESLYLDFSIFGLLSAVNTSFFFLDQVLFSMHAWLVIQHASSALVLIFVLRFTMDALEINWPRLKRILLPGVLVVVSSYLILPAYYLQPIAYLISLSLASSAMLLGLYVFYLTLQKPSGTRIWFSTAFTGMIVLQAHDIYYAFLSSPEAHIHAANWMQLSTPLFAMAFFAHLVHRFTDALEVSESLNRTLEARVAATTEALQESYEKNREFELETRANEERSKIYRTLHDDLGSKLISIVHTAEDPRQMTLARSALESMRESIYRASNPIQSMRTCIEQINEEAELRLTSAGKQYQMKLSIQAEFDIAPNIAYNLTRIIREAISNILQHSGCRQVEFIAKESDQFIEIELVDDGGGEITETLSSGGLSNMRFRAERIGAILNWKGNCLCLSIPKA